MHQHITELTNTELDKALCESITIWAYFLNDDPLLIQHEYQWRIHYKKMERLVNWRTPMKYIYDTIKISKYSSANIFPDVNYVEPCKEVKDALDLRAYNLGVEHERSAKSFENTYACGKTVDVNLLCNTGRMNLKDFIYGIKGSSDEIMTHVFSLIDDGYISLYVEETNGQKEYVIYCTPLTLLILPYKIGPYYSKLFRWFQFCFMDDDLPLQVQRYFEDWAKYDENLKNDYIEYAVILSEFIVRNMKLLSSLALWKEITEQNYPFDWPKINVKTKK